MRHRTARAPALRPPQPQAGLDVLYPVGRLPAGWSTAALTAKASTSNSACYWSVAFGQFVDGKARVYANRTHLCSEEPPLCKPDQEFTAPRGGTESDSDDETAGPVVDDDEFEVFKVLDGVVDACCCRSPGPVWREPESLEGVVFV